MFQSGSWAFAKMAAATGKPGFHDWMSRGSAERRYRKGQGAHCHLCFCCHQQEQPPGTLDLRAQKLAASARVAEESPSVETLKTQFDKILSSLFQFSLLCTKEVGLHDHQRSTQTSSILSSSIKEEMGRIAMKNINLGKYQVFLISTDSLWRCNNDNSEEQPLNAQHRLCVRPHCEVRLLRIIPCANEYKDQSYYNYWSNHLSSSYRIPQFASPIFIPIKVDKGFCSVSCFSAADNSNHSLLSTINSTNTKLFCFDCSKQKSHYLEEPRRVLDTPNP